MLENVSIIIPLGPAEDQLAPLLDDLLRLPGNPEIIVVAGTEETQLPNNPDRVRLIHAVVGRAVQQNTGAKAARREFLWFLHADTRVNKEAFHALEAALKQAPDHLHYFHLKFGNDGPAGMWLNQWGARLRSEIFGLPFGDQGFCLHRHCFDRIGGFPEGAAYGEDHLLVWHARQAGIPLCCTGCSLTTSARKYRIHGWGALTIKYQFLWIKQALPELYRLIRGLRMPV